MRLRVGGRWRSTRPRADTIHGPAAVASPCWTKTHQISTIPGACVGLPGDGGSLLDAIALRVILTAMITAGAYLIERAEGLHLPGWSILFVTAVRPGLAALSRR